MRKKVSFAEYFILVFLNLIPLFAAFFIGIAFTECVIYWQQPKMYEFIRKFWLHVLVITIMGFIVWKKTYKEQLQKFKEENLDFSHYKNLVNFIDWKRRKYNTKLDVPKKK